MSVFIPKKLYGIIGYPLGHSLSPLLHNWGFSQFNLEAVYMSWPLEPEKIKNFMNGFRSLPISGASVTIPHKLSVRKYIDRETERAQGAGAVNTLYWEGDQLIGDNTDVAGFSAPLQPHADHIKSALMIGAGGASRAAICGLKALGINKIDICNRSPEKAHDLSSQFKISSIDWDARADHEYDLIVNSTPLGLSGEREKINPMIMDKVSENTIVYDLVYNPLETVLLKEAKNKGAKTISGIEMFLHQGLEQFKIWTGKNLSPQAARTLLLNKLKETSK